MKRDGQILQELEALSPVLHAMKMELRQPFRVPPGYFEVLEQEVFDVIEAGLAEGMGGNAFAVPDGYFEQLTDSIMGQVEQSAEAGSPAGGRVIDLQQSRRRTIMPVNRWMAMAASVAIFLVLGVVAARFVSNQSGPDERFVMTSASPSLTIAEAWEYVESNLWDYDTDDLASLTDLSEGEWSFGLPVDMEDAYRDYLENNVEDLEEYLLTIEI